MSLQFVVNYSVSSYCTKGLNWFGLLPITFWLAGELQLVIIKNELNVNNFSLQMIIFEVQNESHLSGLLSYNQWCPFWKEIKEMNRKFMFTFLKRDFGDGFGFSWILFSFILPQDN